MLDKGRLYSGAAFEFMDVSKPDRAVMAKSMSRRPTLQDVADAAQVSYATADRVVNARAKVAPKSEARVREAIARLGYARDIHAANLSRGKVYRFRFIIPAGPNSFFDALRAALEAERKALSGERIEISLAESRAFDPASLTAALEKAAQDGVEGVAAVAAESPEALAAMKALRARGVKLATLVSDAQEDARDAYVGVDNFAAGRTVGRLMRLAHRGREGLLLPILGSGAAKDHRERLAGFREVAREGGALALLDPIETQDDPGRMEARLKEAMRRHPGLTGIYSIGAGDRGLVKAMKAAKSLRPMVALHELTPHARRALEEGLIDAVIDQKPVEEIAETLRILRALCDGAPLAPRRDITPTIYLKDNLPGPSGEPLAAARRSSLV